MSSLQLAGRIISLPNDLRRVALKQAFAASTSRLPAKAPARAFATYNTNFEAPPSPSSVNHEEVSHFNALASSWWDPHGSSRLLHLMNPLRHKFIKQCLGSYVRDTREKLRFLDIGCGGGIFAESAARLPMTESVTAIDPTPEVIAVAKKHRRTDPLLLEPGRLTYKNIPIEQLPPPSTPSEGFDVISIFEVIEHIQTPSTFLESILPHLKPGGWLVGSTIARTNTSWFTTKFIAEDVLRMVPRGTHEWSRYIQPNELREWARSKPELDVVVGAKGWQVMGVVYVPGFGWKEVPGSEDWGNYFFAVRKLPESAQ
ncbi:related to COQ3-enzyme of ubiquinone (coenzyme Q) biosynthesis [Lecanosticta acicola]|uniref:Ubiquinone biosynthesis O-methyltransferase, mitochondrial n=1 Tax=Lecanosticta acicola TaxID=111012 RepID=A0AAI8Z1R8_9PEZI|nr:related to COQ3-enzyme of ubiquinone (coenzyme Q) biosynthesis [Lecanosticta acicola]